MVEIVEDLGNLVAHGVRCVVDGIVAVVGGAGGNNDFGGFVAVGDEDVVVAVGVGPFRVCLRNVVAQYEQVLCFDVPHGDQQRLRRYKLAPRLSILEPTHWLWIAILAIAKRTEKSTLAIVGRLIASLFLEPSVLLKL